MQFCTGKPVPRGIVICVQWRATRVARSFAARVGDDVVIWICHTWASGLWLALIYYLHSK